MTKDFKQFLAETSFHDPKFFRKLTIDGDGSSYSKPLEKAYPKVDQRADVVANKIWDDNAPTHEKLKHDHYLPLGSEERSSTRSYTNNSSSINHRMRETWSYPEAASVTTPEDEHAAHISNGIAKHSKPLDNELHVYSGLNSFRPKHKVGDTVHSPMFTSTSLNPHKARTFATTSGDEAHVLHFHLPAGYKKGIYVDGLSHHDGEQEYLLDKGQDWKVAHHEVVHERSITQGRDGTKDRWTTKKKIHIWTMHPVDHVSEAVDHDATPFRNYSAPIMRHAPLKADDEIGLPRIRTITPSKKRRDYHDHLINARIAAVDGVMEQHQRLSMHFSELGAPIPNPREHDSAHSSNIFTSDPLHPGHHIVNYTDGSYSLNNAATRLHSGHEISDKSRDDIKNLEDSINHHARPLPEDVHVYSGLKHTNYSTKVGDVHHLPAFTSTTILPQKSMDYTDAKYRPTAPDSHEAKYDEHILHIHLPKGYKKGVYVDHVSNYPGEREMLLNRNQHIKITGHKRVTRVDGSTRRYIHIWSAVPHEPDAPLKEAVTHDTKPFRSYEPAVKYHKPALKSKINDYNVQMIFSRSQHDIEGGEQSSRLANHFAPLAKPTDNDYMRDHTHVSHPANPIYQYTRVSSSTNHTAIAMSNGEEVEESGQDRVEKLQAAIKAHAKPLPEDVHVYSGLKHAKFSTKVGDVHHLPAFVSTTLIPHRAAPFGNGIYRNVNAVEDHVLHVHLPKGYNKGVYIDHISHYPGEHELLLNRDQHIKITGHKIVAQVSGGHRRFVNIWSAVPHEPEAPVKESFNHDVSHLRRYHSDRSSTQNSDRYKKRSEVTRAALEAHREDSDDHAQVLSRYNSLIPEKTTPAHEEILRQYTGSLSRHINHILICGPARAGMDDFGDDIKLMKETMRYHCRPLLTDSHFYSGVPRPVHNIVSKAHADGTPVHLPAFTSTSTSSARAFGFGFEHTIKSLPGSQHISNVSDKHMLHFKLPAGYKRGLFPGDKSSHRTEQEYILDADQHWKVTNHEVATRHSTQTVTDNPGPGGKLLKKVVTRTHVWTLEPHTPVNEGREYQGDVFKTDWEHDDSTDPFDVEKNHQEGVELEKHHEQIALDDVDHATFKHVRGYTTISAGLNRHLVKTHTSGPDELGNKLHLTRHEHLQRFIDKAAPLEHDTHVYSGLSGFDPSKSMKEGGVFHSPAYLSTSINPHTATSKNNFYRKYMSVHGANTEHLLHIHLPKGYSKGRYIGRYSEHPMEQELLLGAGQKFKVTGHEEHKFGDHTRHVWHAVPHDDESLKEQTYHDTSSMIPPPISKQSPWARALSDSRTVKLAKARNDSDNQHRRLADHFSDIIPKGIHSNTLHAYSESGEDQDSENFNGSSAVVNEHLIVVHNNHPLAQGNATSHAGVRLLDDVFKEHATPLPETVHAYAGISGFNPSKIAVNNVFKTPAFTSTTIRAVTASAFAGHVYKPNARMADHIVGNPIERHVIHFHLPKGYSGGVYMADHSHHSEEHEYLLNRDQHWEITGHSVRTGAFRHKTWMKTHIWSVKPVEKNSTVSELYEPMHPATMKVDWTEHRQRAHWGYTSDETWSDMARVHPQYEWEHKSVAEQHHRLHELHSPSMTREHRDGVLGYTMGGSRATNKKLIAGKVGNTSKILDDMASKTPALDHDVHAYSALGVHPGALAKHKVIQTPAFISASLNPHIAMDVGMANLVKKQKLGTSGPVSTGDQEMHILHLHMPAGSKSSTYIGGAGAQQYSNQRELLIHRNTKLRVTGHHKHDPGKGGIPIHIWSVTPHEDLHLRGHIRSTTYYTSTYPKATEEAHT